MIELELLPVADRRDVALSIAPAGFCYPAEFLAMLDDELPEIFPDGWLFLWKTIPERFAAALEELYPERSLVAFANVDGEDDIFCFDANDHSGDPPVQVIHYAASPDRNSGASGGTSRIGGSTRSGRARPGSRRSMVREAREPDSAPAFAELVDSMRRGGWQGRPVDVVRMPDGEMTTLDNARLAAARAAGIDMQAIVHDPAERLPRASRERFAIGREVPETWGEAALLRIGGQGGRWAESNPHGSHDLPQMRDPD